MRRKKPGATSTRRDLRAVDRPPIAGTGRRIGQVAATNHQRHRLGLAPHPALDRRESGPRRSSLRDPGGLWRERPSLAQIPVRRVDHVPVHLVRPRTAEEHRRREWPSVRDRPPCVPEEREVAPQRIRDEPDRLAAAARSSTSPAPATRASAASAGARQSPASRRPSTGTDRRRSKSSRRCIASIGVAGVAPSAAAAMSPSMRNAGASIRAESVHRTDRRRRARRDQRQRRHAIATGARQTLTRRGPPGSRPGPPAEARSAS